MSPEAIVTAFCQALSANDLDGALALVSPPSNAPAFKYARINLCTRLSEIRFVTRFIRTS